MLERAARTFSRPAVRFSIPADVAALMARTLMVAQEANVVLAVEVGRHPEIACAALEQAVRTVLASVAFLADTLAIVAQECPLPHDQVRAQQAQQ